MLRRLTQSAVIAAAFAGGAFPASADEEIWHLFVSDHTTPAVKAFDLNTGAQIGGFTVSTPARLYAGESGEYVYAVQGEAGLVTAIGSGLEFESHGDHADVEAGEPALVGDILSGDRPVHFVPHDGQIAVFFDGEGAAKVFSESAVGSGSLAVETYTSGRPHHGVAAIFDDHVLLTEAPMDSDASLPDWVRVLEADGSDTGDKPACPGIHGEAASGKLMAFACAEGILVFSEGENGPDGRVLPYPDAFPEGRSGTLRGVEAFEMFVGNYGNEAVILVDPSGEEPYRLVEMPGPQIGFVLDPRRVKYGYAIGFDGKLNEFDLLSGKPTRTVEVTGPYSTEGGHGVARPALAMAGGNIVVTDPEAGQLHVVDAEDFSVSASIDFEGTPYSLVAVGGVHHEH